MIAIGQWYIDVDVQFLQHCFVFEMYVQVHWSGRSWVDVDLRLAEFVIRLSEQ